MTRTAWVVVAIIALVFALALAPQVMIRWH